MLFHELVHVAQYKILGVTRFCMSYTEQWVTERGNPFSMPLERDAYALQNRYESEPNRVFCVVDELRRALLDDTDSSNRT